MDAVLQDFLGNKPSMETPKPEPQPTDTQEQQERANEVAQEQAGEAVPEQADETPQVVRRISGKQRRASLEEYKEASLFRPSKTASPYSSAATRATPLTVSSACSASGG